MIGKLEGPLILAGAGKMGGAMLTGWLESGLAPADVVVQDPAPPPEMQTLLTERGIKVVATLASADLAGPPAVIVAAVKPQIMDDVFPALGQLAGPRTLVLSIAAGKTIASFERHLAKGTAVVRSIPNTPAAIGRGITVCAPNPHVTSEQRRLCDDLLASIGQVGWVEDEALIDAATAVSGSGPAYVFLLAECLAAAGVEAGLSPELSARLAEATIAGSGALLERSELPPSTLRENVTSPNGTTYAALQVLMADDGMKPLLIKAVAAATRRSRELAG